VSKKKDARKKRLLNLANLQVRKKVRKRSSRQKLPHVRGERAHAKYQKGVRGTKIDVGQKEMEKMVGLRKQRKPDLMTPEKNEKRSNSKSMPKSLKQRKAYKKLPANKKKTEKSTDPHTLSIMKPPKSQPRTEK